VWPRKSLYTCQWSLFWIKKKSCVFDFLKKISPTTTFGLHCVWILVYLPTSHRDLTI
jgi:hypothetical protein